MENEGLPAFIAVIVAAVLIVGVVVGMAVVSWVFLLQ